ncbi:MAG TPA: glucose-6-phosphate dehydrogenase [Syntrophorhabdaceae bacterium]|nr:glucose-6-phosphate dehydrogenase [Syntrophorhabdaceae bacterium]
MDERGFEKIIEGRFLQTCDIPEETLNVEPFTMVIFGGAGDLSKRKLLPSLYHLYSSNELTDEFSVLAFDKLTLTRDEYLAMTREAVKTFEESSFHEDAWRSFAGHLHYMSGFFEYDENYRKLNSELERLSRSAIRDVKNVIYYMAVPPQVAPPLIEKLRLNNFCKGAFQTRIVMEKPFGRDRNSAQALNKILTNAFDENQIYRIDHYLARDPVQNIIFFRFTNTLFEEVWDRRLVDNVQITVAESIGIEHRGQFYEQAGVVRDMLQNHIMQILGLTAMEPPVGFDADSVRDEKLKIMRSLRPVDSDYIDRFMVRGQYGGGLVGGQPAVGYRAEPNVSSHSTEATFFAGKFYIDNLRWAGIPFFIRTGKRMPAQVTEICIELKRLPLRLFGRTCDILEPNILRLTIQPDEKISLGFGVKYPYSHNQIYSVNMVFSYKEAFKMHLHHPYNRLLIDVIKGDLTLFVREDEIEAMWTVVDPIVKRWEERAPENFPNYEAGTWGPSEAQNLVSREGRTWNTA